MTAIRDRGETPFNEAGDGCILRFTNADLRALQQELGPQFISDVPSYMEAWDFAYMDKLLAYGVKKDGERVAVTMEGALDNVPVAITAGKLLDALFVSYHGMTFQDHILKVAEAMEAEIREHGPLNQTPDTILSRNFASGGLPQASTPKSSGASAPSKSESSRARRRSRASGKPG